MAYVKTDWEPGKKNVFSTGQRVGGRVRGKREDRGEAEGKGRGVG